MGAEYRTKVFEFCPSEAELRRRWSVAQREDQYERGHGAYQGSIGDTDLYVSRTTFKTFEDVQKFAQDQDIEKRSATAWRYGEGAPVFPATAKDRELEALVKKLSDELELFERSILLRFVQSKSASKRCTHCDSVISKKSREPLTRQDFRRTLSTLDFIGQREYIAEQTNCPACGHNLLLTETDLKRRESLKTRHAEASKRLDKAKEDFKAKAKPYGYYVLACVPT